MAVDRASAILDQRLMRVVFAIAATIVGVTTIATRSGDAVDWSLVPVTIVVFWLWATFERFPIALLCLFGFSVPLTLNLVESDAEVSMFLVVITAAVLAAFEHHRVEVTVVLVFVMMVFFVLGLTAINNFAWPNWLFGIAFSWGFGEMAYRYQQTIGELEHARALVADQAAVHERRRIARDVHDLVGHSLSVVMLHVTGARHLVRKDPDEAERALEQAEAAGRDSLAEIRRTVGMLRDDSDAQAVVLPSPDLGDISHLVDEYLLGGVDISLDVDGVPAEVEGAAGLAGYRIVQEALTNVTRHTIGARVIVSLDIGEQHYDLEIRNSGGSPIGLKNGSGFGLVSMRERAKSVGGLLIAGPTPDGWTVEATLPVRAVQASQ